MPVRTYLVCATPRSGSTLLCELLKDTGVAGRPEEFFESDYATGLPPHPGDYLEHLPRTGAGIRDDLTPPHAPEYSSLQGIESYRHHLDRTLRLGTSPNRVFGAKVMWRHLSNLTAGAGTLPEYMGTSLPDLLERLFGEPRFIWVTREDKVRQAVSLWRALQSRVWRREHHPDDARTPTLHYRFSGIDHLVRSLRADDEAWRQFFLRERIDFHRVSYEGDLERDLDHTMRAVLAHIGAEAPPNWRASAPMHRQADSLSEEWVAAYHRDVALHGGEQIAVAGR